MKIGIIPYGNSNNPFQVLLYDAIGKLGHDMRHFKSDGILPITKATRSEIDILHFDWLHSFYLGSSLFKSYLKQMQLMSDLALKKRLPFTCNVHNLSHRISRGFSTECHDRLLKAQSCLISMTDVGIQKIRQAYPFLSDTPIYKIPHGHYIDWYPNVVGKHDARQKLNIKDATNIGVFFGRIQPYKGLEKLILNFKKLGDAKCRLIIAGKPTTKQYEKTLRDLIGADRRILFFSDFIDKDDVQIYLNAADFSILPFTDVFNSGSLILSLSFGRPVLIPKMDALLEVAPPEYAKAYSDDREFEQYLEMAFKNPEQCFNLSYDIYGYLRQNFEWATIAQLYLNMWKNC